MNLMFGDTKDGIWSVNLYIPSNSCGKTVAYSIWVNDTNGQTNSSSTSYFTVRESPWWWWLLVFLLEQGIDFIIIIIIGSVAASAIVSSTVIVRRRSLRGKPKKVSKSKLKKRKDIGAEEIRKILAESEKSTEIETITYEGLKKMITKPFSVISEDIVNRVRKLKNLTEEEKGLLLEDLAALDDKQKEEWLKEVEELE